MRTFRFSLLAGTLVAIWLVAVGSRVDGQSGPQPVSVASGTLTNVVLSSDTRQSVAGNLNAQVVGTVAEDSPLAGNPVQIGGRAASAVPNAVTANDVVRPWYSLFGAQNVIVRDSTGGSVMDDTNDAMRVNVVAGANVDLAQGAAIVAQPGPLQMGEASTVPPTAVTAQQVRRQWLTLTGATVTVGDLCGNPGTTTSVAITTAASGNTQLVALVASQIVYVCGYQMFVGGTSNVSLVYGTGSACATGEVALTGAFPFIAQTGIAVSNGGGVQMKGAASNAVCLKNSAAVQVSGVLTYVQR